MTSFDTIEGDFSRRPLETKAIPIPSNVFKNGLVPEETANKHLNHHSTWPSCYNKANSKLFNRWLDFSVERHLDHCCVTSYLL